jgi:hypothetical protein
MFKVGNSKFQVVNSIGKYLSVLIASVLDVIKFLSERLYFLQFGLIALFIIR